MWDTVIKNGLLIRRKKRSDKTLSLTRMSGQICDGTWSLSENLMKLVRSRITKHIRTRIITNEDKLIGVFGQKDLECSQLQYWKLQSIIFTSNFESKLKQTNTIQVDNVDNKKSEQNVAVVKRETAKCVVVAGIASSNSNENATVTLQTQIVCYTCRKDKAQSHCAY